MGKKLSRLVGVDFAPPSATTEFDDFVLFLFWSLGRPSRFGLKTTFIDEGTFKARVLGEDEEFPVPDAVDFSTIPVPVSFSSSAAALF